MILFVRCDERKHVIFQKTYTKMAEVFISETTKVICSYILLQENGYPWMAKRLLYITY